MTRVPTEAQNLRAGDRVELQGLVISVIPGFAKTKVTFKGPNERTFPNTQVVQVLVVEVPVLVESVTT